MKEIEIAYRRNAGTSYMILPQLGDVSAFEEEMLLHNEIPVLLTFFSMQSDGCKQFWYDISAKKSIRHLFEQSELSKEQLYYLLLRALEAYKKVGEYLISDSHIYFMEDTVFVTGYGMDMEVYLCYTPDDTDGMTAAWMHLYEFLMPRIDSQDEDLVQLIYEGYQRLSDGSFSFQKMEDDLREKLCGLEQFSVAGHSGVDPHPITTKMNPHSVTTKMNPHSVTTKMNPHPVTSKINPHPVTSKINPVSRQSVEGHGHDRRLQLGHSKGKTVNLLSDKDVSVYGQGFPASHRSPQVSRFIERDPSDGGYSRSQGRQQTAKVSPFAGRSMAKEEYGYCSIPDRMENDPGKAGVVAEEQEFVPPKKKRKGFFAGRKRKETDIWEDPPEQNRQALLEELYADDDEEEEASLGQKVKGLFLGVPNMILQRVQKEKDNYFPPQDLEEDLVYDPGENLPAPTVLLSHDMGQCYGRLVYEGSRGEKDYILDKSEYHIGSRDERNEVLLHSATVSRHHARIWREGDDFYVEDLNSTNGTFVNGEIVNINEPRKLCYMDQIAFADVEYRMV